MKMKFGEIGIAKDDDRELISTLIDYQGFCAGPKGGIKSDDAGGRTMDEAEVSSSEENASFHSIEPKECLDKLSNGWTPWVIDVRLQTEHDIVALPFTDEVAPHRTVKIDNVPKVGDVLVYCKAGVRGKKACNRLIELGVDPDRLHNLDGGIMRWQKEVDPTMPTY
jgi:rhodanese-related sulfurtransferase